MVGYYIIWLIRRVAVNKYINVGYGIFNSTFQGIILLLEAVLVGMEMYMWAILCVVLLVVINAKELHDILDFGISQVRNIIKNKRL